MANKDANKKFYQCQVCGADISHKQIGAKFCSDECLAINEIKRKKSYYVKDKEKYDARANKWRKENPEAYLEIQRRYRRKRRERLVKARKNIAKYGIKGDFAEQGISDWT